MKLFSSLLNSSDNFKSILYFCEFLPWFHSDFSTKYISDFKLSTVINLQNSGGSPLNDPNIRLVGAFPWPLPPQHWPLPPSTMPANQQPGIVSSSSPQPIRHGVAEKAGPEATPPGNMTSPPTDLSSPMSPTNNCPTATGQ